MQRIAILMGLAILVGCQTTRFVDVPTPERGSVMQEINERAAEQEATVTLTDRTQLFTDIRGFHLTTESWSFVNPYSNTRTREPLGKLSQIEFENTSRPALGALIGGLAGGLLLGGLSASDNQQCQAEEFCIFDWSDSQAFGAGFLIGGLGGAMVGALIGGLTGKPGAIYRFHPGTAEQVSVVIGRPGPVAGNPH